MDNVLHMDDYRQSLTLTINTGKAVHVYPVVYFEAIVEGKEVEPIPDDVLRAIVNEWLQDTLGRE